MADWAGKTLGKVEIKDLVARGGMAEVYTGNSESFGQVAVKVMRGLLDRDSDQLARFQREAEVIEDLRHPNIVQMFEYDIVDESPYLVMEYIPGPSLAAYLKSLHDNKQRIPIGMVAQILKSIASALDYAHSKGIVHRDIKPANVLLRSRAGTIQLNKPLPEDVEPVLTDFGLVRLLDSTMHTTAGSVSGTPTYMSPEQARGEKVDKRTDIYSLGIMLYEMLAGTVPFQADTTFGMLMKHINEPPPTINGLSTELQSILDRTLAKDPALRYENAGDLADEFIALFNGQTISPGTIHIAQLAREAAEASKQPTMPQPERRSRRWLRISVEAALVIILAVVIRQFMGSPTTSVALTPAPVDPNIPVGRLRFDDFNYFLDNGTLTLNTVNKPEDGLHLEVWLKGQNSDQVRGMGPVEFSATGAGRVEITDPNQKNFLLEYDQVFITLEPDGGNISQPTGEVLYSSVFPLEALVHVRHVLVSFGQLPDKGPLMQNLWYYSASYVNRSINGNEFEEDFKVGLVQAFNTGDEATVLKRNEEIINMIVGDKSDLYRDYNGDGTIDDPGDGYGSLANGDRLGYLQETALHAKYAADAVDSTANIRTFSENMQVCIRNLDGWTNHLLSLALQLNETPFGPEMEPIISEIAVVGKSLLSGVDVNENNRLNEVIAGECGADTAYEQAYFMADMFIYPGADRIPPTGK
jgi:serine/threonine protein kinase